MSIKKETESALAKYFSGVSAEIDVVMVGKIPYVDITYTDFKPTPQVIDELRKIIPNMEMTRIERSFSPEAICRELLLAYEEDLHIILQEDKDTFRSTTLGIFVEERMQHKDIGMAG